MSDRPVLTNEDVAHIAGLARLNLTDDEQVRFLSELNDALSMAEALDKIDTTDLPETHHAIGQTNVWRDDVATETLVTEDVFGNTPRHEAEHFIIPNPLA